MAGKVVLYAEDSPDDVAMFQEAMSECGDCQVEIAADGQYLLEMLAALDRSGNLGDVHFIVLDVGLPRKDGIEVLFEIKKNPRYRPIPVIIFTGGRMERNIVKAYALGCSSYVEKPGSYESLLATLRGLIP